MAAQRIYLKILQLALRSASNLSRRRIDELNEYVPQLRQLLSCVVCCKLLMDPYTPKGRRCGHHVCRLCVRGRKSLMPSCSQCSDCSDFRTYEENRAMALQLLCYKTLCAHLLQSALFAQLGGLGPELGDLASPETPRIRLPFITTQQFIREGANYDDMRDTFLPQPDMPILRSMPSSLPAETPPTTAATTPELPYEQQLPEALSINDIEMEAATTAEQFAHPLPIMPTGSRMFAHGMVQQPQPHLRQATATRTNVVAHPATQLPAGFLESSWNEQVDLSAALSISNFPAGPSFTTYVPSAAAAPIVRQALPQVALPAIGQVVHVTSTTQPQAMQLHPVAAAVAAPPIGKPGSFNPKRKHGEMEVDNQEDDMDFSDNDDEDYEGPAVSSNTRAGTRMTLRNKNATIISSVQVKPPASVAADLLPAAVIEDHKPAPTSCRCGTTTNPNNKTCRTNRCPCYRSGQGCKDCKCCKCQNPLPMVDTTEYMPQAAPSSAPNKEVTTKQAQGQELEPTPEILFVSVSNVQQSQYPVVLMENEDGLLQPFNTFTKGDVPVPIHPERLGFQRMLLSSNEATPQYVYVMPPQAPVQVLPPEPCYQQPAKKLKNVIRVETIVPPPTGANLSSFASGPYSPIESIDEFVSGASTSTISTGDSALARNAAAGDSIATDDAHPSLEDIMSDSDL